MRRGDCGERDAGKAGGIDRCDHYDRWPVIPCACVQL